MPERINPQWVRQEVEKVLAFAMDHADAQAHDAEDDLYAAVLTHIANATADDPAECAKAALLTKQIKFSRWFE